MRHLHVALLGSFAAVVALAGLAAADPGSESGPPIAATAVAVPSGVPAGALTGPQVGAPAPAFDLRTIDGHTVSLEQFRGKTLVINVWATWCPPCRLEMPELINAYPALHRSGVEFLGVDSTEEAPIVRAYASAKMLPYAQAIDADRSFSKAYDVAAFPTTYVVDPQGVLRARYVDMLGAAQLAALVAAGRESRNAAIVSTLQTKIDAVLTPALAFDGDAPTVTANTRRAADAIKASLKLVDDSDPAKGASVDYVRTQAEQEALRARAIDAFAKVATSDADKALLNLLRGDSATSREHWDEALAAYQATLETDPKNDDALAGLAYAAGRLNRWDVAVVADVKRSAAAPGAVEPLVDLGIALGRARRFNDAYAAFETATTLGRRAVTAKPGDATALRTLAWAYLYAGRTHVRGDDARGARAAFEHAFALAKRLPAGDRRHDMYLEESQEALVALDLGAHRVTAISLAPWTGPELPGSVPNTLKYRLIVAGKAGRSVDLHAAGVPHGWVASFCTDRICSPSRVNVAIPPSGVKVVEFQLVPPRAKAKASVRVIATDGGSTATATTS